MLDFLNITSVYKRAAAAGLMLLVFLILSVNIALKKSNTWDEPAHILAGYAYLNNGMDYISPLHHPAFGRLLTGVFTSSMLGLDFDQSVKSEEASMPDFYRYSIKFLYKNRVSAGKILFLSRLPNMILAAILGAYVFAWSNELWGHRGAFLSLFFFILSPNILAHSSLATTDLPVTAFFFISVFYLYRISTRGGNLARVLAAAVFMAFAFTSKHTAFLLLPVSAAAFMAGMKKEPARKAIPYYLLLLLFLYTGIWAVYGFRFHSGGGHYQSLPWDKFSSSSLAHVFGFLRDTRLLPEAYLYSIAGVLSGAGTGRAAFLMGSTSHAGWWYYFLVAFFIKTPIPTLILLIDIALFLSKDSGFRRKALWVSVPALLVFTAMSLQKVNIGLRHILPVYPFIFTLIGMVPYMKTGGERLARGLVYGLCAWYLFSAASIFPHQLAYFNELAGGPKNGYRFLIDSNLDWGQDLPGLKRYIEEKKIDKIKLAYFGLSDPAFYGIEYEYLPSYMIMNGRQTGQDIKLEGYFAISATLLQGEYLDRDYYAVFRGMKPIDTIGYSIFIYKL